eukprot:TRINITY_DN66266_c0_g1_i1.p1 TRINITY_DN66266_c0_g1~~TRINITY_DN66266_c0_g1_i1.p1  ORF type:complete len:146 (+),score=26.72 TRINITY_DN66266_c0_g1_i1:112-549(+)
MGRPRAAAVAACFACLRMGCFVEAACERDRHGSCDCVLGGSVAGHKLMDSHECIDGEISKKAFISGNVDPSATSYDVACDSMKLQTFCIHRYGCLTEYAKTSCRRALEEDPALEGCDVNCDGATRASALLASALALAAAAAAALH